MATTQTTPQNITSESEQSFRARHQHGGGSTQIVFVRTSDGDAWDRRLVAKYGGEPLLDCIVCDQRAHLAVSA